MKSNYLNPENLGQDMSVHSIAQLEYALNEAKRIYTSCGGHKLAARMHNAIDRIEAEIARRDFIEPGVTK